MPLVSHTVCPYVPRAAIVLAGMGLPFERRDVDLADKPEWFCTILLLGNTPVLLNAIAAFYNSAEAATLRARRPDFGGAAVCIVDAAFAAVLRHFDGFDAIGDFGFWNGWPKLRRWRAALVAPPSADAALRVDYSAPRRGAGPVRQTIPRRDQPGAAITPGKRRPLLLTVCTGTANLPAAAAAAAAVSVTEKGVV